MTIREEMAAAMQQVRRPGPRPRQVVSSPLSALRCISLEEFQLWASTLPASVEYDPLRLTPEGVRKTFCADCLPEHEREMRGGGRCVKPAPPRIERQRVQQRCKPSPRRQMRRAWSALRLSRRP